MNDPAFVGLRARNAELDLHATQSVLGMDGYAFPLIVRGNLLGALVVGQRPGEHFAAEERQLLFHVAHEVGAALFALRAQESEARAQESEAQARAVKAEAEVSQAQVRATQAQLLEARAREADARAREAVLLDALRTAGSATGP